MSDRWGVNLIPAIIRKFRVMENNEILFATDSITEAEVTWHEVHRKNPRVFHEIHRFDKEKQCYIGIYQLAPYDCPDCGRRPETCKCQTKYFSVEEGKRWSP